MSRLILIRGLPGSGKSTMATSFAGYMHFEADQFFERDGRYVFDAARLDEAHKVCFEKTRVALAQGRNVVVANTFSRRSELEPYLALGASTVVVEARGRFANVHCVSDALIARMASQWEPWSGTGWSPVMIEPGSDAVTVWESLTRADDSIAAIGLFTYTPLAPLQERVASEANALESARQSAEQDDIPFWDAVMRNGLRGVGLADATLKAVPLSNPATIEPTSMTRTDVLRGALRDQVKMVSGGAVTAVVSSVELRCGASAHFPMLDFRCPLGKKSEELIIRIGQRLLGSGGIILNSGRSYHLVGRATVTDEALQLFLARSLFYVPLVDRMYVAHHLLRRRCTLRISPRPESAIAPVVVATF